MREQLFQSIIALLQLPCFKGSDGTTRVYDWPTTQPSGYPYVVVTSQALESQLLDTSRDTRFYNYSVQVVGEKFGEQVAFTQSKALQAMRNVEDLVMAAIDANMNMSNPNVTRISPVVSSYGFTDGNSRVVLSINLMVEVTVNVAYTQV